ncbi:MAG: hypothetical protein ACI9OJ_004048 [Myxococcota bacterium]|jgi:hypothetical protein
MSTQTQSRAHFRVGYPLAERPQLIVGDAVHQVMDCCEAGFRYYSAGFEMPEIGAWLEGRIRFRRGATVSVRGRVVWAEKGQIAVSLTDARIPLSIIYDEQRYLRKNYPVD